mmetsp:Transcript_104403/g.272598  ORF Transcript_104403/g.272598 Transcript_104403/m.272598 type:complete len:218 (+) Transcript_104403:652-1305(+)
MGGREVHYSTDRRRCGQLEVGQLKLVVVLHRPADYRRFHAACEVVQLLVLLRQCQLEGEHLRSELVLVVLQKLLRLGGECFGVDHGRVGGKPAKPVTELLQELLPCRHQVHLDKPVPEVGGLVGAVPEDVCVVGEDPEEIANGYLGPFRRRWLGEIDLEKLVGEVVQQLEKVGVDHAHLTRVLLVGDIEAWMAQAAAASGDEARPQPLCHLLGVIVV